jgi:hypothetical protein
MPSGTSQPSLFLVLTGSKQRLDDNDVDGGSLDFLSSGTAGEADPSCSRRLHTPRNLTVRTEQIIHALGHADVAPIG